VRTRARHFWLLVTAQSLCVAAGLWMQYFLLHSSWSPRAAQPTGLAQSLIPVALVTFIWTVGLLAMTTYLTTQHSHEAQERERLRSNRDMLVQIQTLARTRDAIIFALAKLAGFRDHETGGHLERISIYATLLATALRSQPRFARQVTPGFVRLIGLTSVLHDIGKVGIEDAILRKPGPLSTSERERMQTHTLMAWNCLSDIAQRLGDSHFLRMARDIALAHHEHWDGSGYPHGQRAEQIPLAARIVAIADVYDALSMPRVYKAARPHSECVAVIRAAAGTQFDPDLVQVWLALEERFREIASTHLESIATPFRSNFVPAATLPAAPYDGPVPANREVSWATAPAAVPAAPGD
jgi:response regulator RpfG family c-di-GMP phosphodiesterase